MNKTTTTNPGVNAIVSIAERPDMLPQVLAWENATWGAEWAASVEEFVAREGGDSVFVACKDGQAVGCAMLIDYDMTTRRDLSPWLGGIFVPPTARHQGIASQLVRHALNVAQQMGIHTLWLYTASNRSLYERLGWKFVEDTDYEGETVTVMRYDFSRVAGEPTSAAT